MSTIERRIIAPVEALGQYCILLARAFRALGSSGVNWNNIMTQMVRVGIESIPIIALAAVFSGSVTTVQTAYQLQTPFIPRSIIGAIVTPSMILELGAVVTGFILAGRVGARIAAELGTMRVTEQIDALEAMGLNSVGYLIIPRVVAGVVMFPVLYIIACFVGIGGGIVLADAFGFLPAGEFIDGARQFFNPFDPVFGMIKSVTFGFIITTVACYKGYHTTGGAEGVGKNTTEAVVLSVILILFADLALAMTLL